MGVCILSEILGIPLTHPAWPSDKDEPDCLKSRVIINMYGMNYFLLYSEWYIKTFSQYLEKSENICLALSTSILIIGDKRVSKE